MPGSGISIQYNPWGSHAYGSARFGGGPESSKPPESPTSQKPASNGSAADKAEFSRPPKAAQQPEKQPWYKRVLNVGKHTLLTTFHLAATALLLVGVPFLHAPLWVGAAALLGIQFLQNMVFRYFPGSILEDEKSMGKVARSVYRKFDKVLLLGRRLLRKIPVFGRFITPIYSWLGSKLMKGVHKLSQFFFTRLIHKWVMVNKVDFSHCSSTAEKALHLIKMLLRLGLKVMLIPLPGLGGWVTNFFNLTDAVNLAEAAVPKEPQKAKEPHKEANPEPDGHKKKSRFKSNLSPLKSR